MKTISQHYQDFSSYMRAKNRSKLTLRDYDMYFKAFLTYAGDITPNKINIFLVDGFERTLLKRKIEPATMSYYLIFVRNFLKYLIRQDVKTLNYQKIELPKVQRKLLPALNEKEVRILISICDSRSSDGLRAKVVILFLLTSGARVAEIASLKLTDLEIEENRATIMGKGRKMRVIFFDSETAYYLKKYLAERNVKSSYVFTHEARDYKDKSITTRSIERLVGKYGEKSGISKPVYPHILRRTFATRMLRKGVNIRQLQAFMGHNSIETTSRYIFIEQDELKKIHELAHKKATRSVVEKEQIIIGRESFQKLTGMVGKTMQRQKQILEKLDKESRESKSKNTPAIYKQPTVN